MGGATFPWRPRRQAAPQRGLWPKSAPISGPCVAETAELFSGWILAPRGDVGSSSRSVPGSPLQARHQLPRQLQRQRTAQGHFRLSLPLLAHCRGQQNHEMSVSSSPEPVHTLLHVVEGTLQL